MDSESDSKAALERYVLSGVKETGRLLGAGGYGRVVEVEYYPWYRGVKCAAKSVHEGESRREVLLALYKECILLSQFDHPNIVRFVGIYYRPEANPLPILVMELVPNTLNSYLNDQQPGRLPDQTKYSILRDVARGLEYLHSRPDPVMHCDLITRNILLSEELHYAKICGFSTSKTLTRFRSSSLIPLSGNYHMAPEACKPGPFNPGTKVDIFSYGVLILHVCSEFNPTPGVGTGPSPLDQRKFYLDRMGPNHPLRSLVVECLSVDPSRRPTAVQVLHRVQEMLSGQ